MPTKREKVYNLKFSNLLVPGLLERLKLEKKELNSSPKPSPKSSHSNCKKDRKPDSHGNCKDPYPIKGKSGCCEKKRGRKAQPKARRPISSPSHKPRKSRCKPEREPVNGECKGTYPVKGKSGCCEKKRGRKARS